MDERKLALYKWMVEVGKTTIEKVPEPYREALSQEQEEE